MKFSLAFWKKTAPRSPERTKLLPEEVFGDIPTDMPTSLPKKLVTFKPDDLTKIQELKIAWGLMDSDSAVIRRAIREAHRRTFGSEKA